MLMDTEFYLWLNDQQKGPYEQDHLVSWITESSKNKDVLCWTQGMHEWKPIGEIFADAAKAKRLEESIWCDQEYVDKILEVSNRVSQKAGKAFDFCYKFASRKLNKSLTKHTLPKIFAEAAEDGIITAEEEAHIRKVLAESDITWEEACELLSEKTRSFVREVLADAISDGVVTQEEQDELIRYIELFLVDDLEHEVMSVIRRTNVIYNLGRGVLTHPLPSYPIWLKSGESIYFETYARYVKEAGVQAEEIFGALYVTNTRIEFLSDDFNLSKPLSSIRACESTCWSELLLNFNPLNGSGSYLMEDAQLAEAYIIALTKSSNRTGSLSYGTCTVSERRKISKEVRHAIWIRDAGKCTECGAVDYLEFDHIIPVSKGGSNSSQNIQLLCRRCNGKKSDRI
jgi:hypothetical protein